jgi:glutamyl-tRNA reductase
MFEISRSRRKDLYIFDLAVPRDIEPGAGNIPGIFIKNIDDLTANFDNHNVKLLPRIKRAELLIEKEIKVLQKEIIKNAVKSWNKAQPAGIETG